jgi:hypothetical protein
VFREAVPLGDAGKRRARQIAEVLGFEKSVVPGACPREFLKETRPTLQGEKTSIRGSSLEIALWAKYASDPPSSADSLF